MGSVIFDILIGNLLILQQLGIYSLFLICLHIRLPKPNFHIKLVSFIGTRTYGIFFSHFYVYGRVEWLLHYLDGLGTIYIKFFQFLLVVVVSTGIGAITWKFVELPGIKFGVKLCNKFIK
jgi:peptidoglycan/LPS O-acetylase OafA/YrhL